MAVNVTVRKPGAAVVPATAMPEGVASSLASGSVTASSSQGSDGSILTLEPNTFLGKLLPDYDSGVGYPSSKHVTWAYRSADGKCYSHGGDYSAGAVASPQSYRTDHYRADVGIAFADLSDRTAGWEQVREYCEEADNGGVQPKSPDAVGWVYDSTRDIFWSVPGFHVTPVSAVCAGRTSSSSDDALFKFNHIMTFDPSAAVGSAWTDYGQDTEKISAESMWFSAYDPTTDTVIRCQSSGGSSAPAQLDVIDCAATVVAGSIQWLQHVNVGNDSGGNPIKGWTSQIAIDVEGRQLFLMSYDAVGDNQPLVYSVDVDDLVSGTATVTEYGAAPFSVNMPQVNGLLVWDSNSRRLLILEDSADATLCVLNPMTGVFELPGPTRNPDVPPRCRHAWVFDPAQNVAAALGENGSPSTFRQWVYRYQEAQPQYVSDIARGAVARIDTVSTYADTPRAALPAEWDDSTGLGDGKTGSNGAAMLGPWGSACIDPIHKRYFIHGGGHNDSANNGLIECDLEGGAAPNGWRTEFISDLADVRYDAQEYADGAPTGIHTYDGLDFGAGQIWRAGGSSYSGSGGITKRLWSYDLSTQSWTNHATLGLPTLLGWSLVYDKVSNKVIVAQFANDVYSVWDVGGATLETDGAGVGGNTIGPGYETCAALDVKRGRLLKIGAGELVRLDWNGSTLSYVGTVGSGDVSEIESGDAPSICYDEDLDCFWVMKIGNGDSSTFYSRLYHITADDYTVTRHDLTGTTPSAGSPGFPSGAPGGGYGLLRSLQGWDALALAFRVDQGIYIIRKPDIGQTGLWG